MCNALGRIYMRICIVMLIRIGINMEIRIRIGIKTMLILTGLAIRIRIQSGQWIRIQEGKNDPQKYKFLKVHVLKC